MTGVLDPDVTGTYLPIGPYGGKPSYKLDGQVWYLWWYVAGENWQISPIRGNIDGPSWFRIGDIEGVYTPVVPATGNATVAEI